MRKLLLSLTLVFLITLFLFPVVNAEILYHSNFSIDGEIINNDSIGFITPFETGAGDVEIFDGVLIIVDPTTGENGFRTGFVTVNITDNIYMGFRYYANQSSGFGAIGLTNCSVNGNMGFREASTCLSEGNFFLQNVITFGSVTPNAVRIANTDVGTYTNFVFQDYVIFFNRTNSTVVLYQDSVFLGGMSSIPGSFPAFLTGVQMQSGGGQTGTYAFDELCVWTESSGDQTFDCQPPEDVTPPSTQNFQNDVVGFADTGDNINFSVRVLDDFGLDSYIFGWNDTGTFVNDSSVPVFGVVQDVNTIKTVSAALGFFVCAEYFIVDAQGLENSSGLSCFTVTPPPPDPLPLAGIASIAAVLFMFIIIVRLSLGGKK